MVFAGEVAEWLKATDCKSVLSEYAGSNPALSTSKPVLNLLSWLSFVVFVFNTTKISAVIVRD
jgi:hypothetical protein